MNDHESRICTLERKMHEMDVRYSVINTKLTAIIWILSAIGTATIGVLIKYLFSF